MGKSSGLAFKNCDFRHEPSGITGHYSTLTQRVRRIQWNVIEGKRAGGRVRERGKRERESIKYNGTFVHSNGARARQREGGKREKEK